MSGLITAEQLAEELSLRPGTVKRWTQEGIIPCLRLSGKVVRYDPDEVAQSLKKKALETRKGAARCTA
ncbi:MAG: helix-turn-helix domain-containing protein [Planctomycetota bacterium]